MLKASCVAYSTYAYVEPMVSLKIIAYDPPPMQNTSGTVQYVIATTGAWVIVKDIMFPQAQLHPIQAQGVGIDLGTFPGYQFSSYGTGHVESIRVFVNPDPNPVPWDNDSWWFYGWVAVSVAVER